MPEVGEAATPLRRHRAVSDPLRWERAVRRQHRSDLELLQRGGYEPEERVLQKRRVPEGEEPAHGEEGAEERRDTAGADRAR